MSEMTAMPILAAPPPASAIDAAAPLPGTHGKGVREAGSQAATAAPKAAGDQSDGGVAPADGDSFATVLGRQLAKDIEDRNELSAITTANLAAAPADPGAIAADAKEKKAEEQPAGAGDGAAAGIATLLPLLQSLLAGAAGPRLDAKGDAGSDQKIVGNSDLKFKGKGDAKSAVAALQGAPLQAEAADGEPGAPIAHRLGENKTTQPQAALGAGETNSGATSAAAIPAASPLLAKVAASRSESADALEASFANLLASAQAPAAQGQVSRAATPLAVEAPMGSRNWDSNVGDKLVWMVGHHEQHADLVLNPPQLGRVEVSISVNGDQANAQFVSANPAVRDALEAAIPRLREMLADAGLNLGQAQVGSESAQNASGNSANNPENSDNSRRGSSVAGQVGALGQVGAGSVWLRAGTGMVDVFA